jgi:hypothetical protein
MSLTRLGHETITVVRAGLVVSAIDNSESRSWSAATRTDIPYCSVQPFLMASRLIQEDTASREYSNQYLRCWLPSDAAIVPASTDRLEWNGLDLEAYGQVGTYNDHQGNLHHYQIIARQRSG